MSLGYHMMGRVYFKKERERERVENRNREKSVVFLW